MKKFLIYIAVGAIVFFCFDKLFYVFLIHSPKVQADKRLELVLDGQMNQEIIVLGSSRGARNILAGKLEEETGQSSYNLSYPGSDVVFHEYILRTLLQFNHPPKTILLTVDAPYELWPSSFLVFRYERLYPLTVNPYVLDELVEKGEKNAFLARWFILHRLSQSSFRIRNIPFTELDSISSNGSMPISYRDESIQFEYYDDSLSYDLDLEVSEKVEAFKKIDSTCLSNGIELILVFPPNFSDYNTAFEKRMDSLSGYHNPIFVYDQTAEQYKQKQYFFDDVHLTLEGAKIFTSELAVFLNSAGPI